MPDINTTNKTIVKNTIVLYFRMLILIFVGLYTSRVILQVLGVDDYGIYTSVGGVVGLMTSLNAALSTGSSRFLTFELGRDDEKRLKSMFSTLLSAHIVLGLLIILLCETIGLWIVYNKLIIPAERFNAALICFHLSVLSCFIGIVQVPYRATIISHERMNVYAYTSILDAVLKLAIVFALYKAPFDMLVFYALLLAIESALVAYIYKWYCAKNFEEAHYHIYMDKGIMKEVLGYSLWNLLSNVAVTLKDQGAVVLINMFFNPSVVTAQSVANKVNETANQFVDNFRTAANPQIVKRYAAGDFAGSKSLMLNSTKYSYFMLLVLGLPIILVAKPLLFLWLGQIPEHSVAFLQILMISSIINVFNSSLYTAVYAKGRIKENAISGSIIWLMVLPCAYVFYKRGSPPITIAYITLFFNAILSFIQKPVILHTVVKYKWKDLLTLFKDCLIVTMVAVPIPVFLYLKRDLYFPNEIVQFLILILISVICVGVSVWALGLDPVARKMVIAFVKTKLHK